MDNMPLGGYTMIVHQGQPHLNEIYAAGPIHPLLRREFERDLRELKQARAAYNKHRHLT
jgi:hypothetical protein